MSTYSMRISKVEAAGILASIAIMAAVLWFVRFNATEQRMAEQPEPTAAIYVSGEGDQDAALANAVTEASSATGRLEKIVIDDIQEGTGPAAESGDTVTVHYIGTLRNGQQFDNSYLKGEPFTFKIGSGKVIKGWEAGLIGMKAGGQRVLVIPPEYAYGEAGAGPIPGDATLVFAIELLEIN